MNSYTGSVLFLFCLAYLVITVHAETLDSKSSPDGGSTTASTGGVGGAFVTVFSYLCCGGCCCCKIRRQKPSEIEENDGNEANHQEMAGQTGSGRGFPYELPERRGVASGNGGNGNDGLAALAQQQKSELESAPGHQISSVSGIETPPPTYKES